MWREFCSTSLPISITLKPITPALSHKGFSMILHPPSTTAPPSTTTLQHYDSVCLLQRYDQLFHHYTISMKPGTIVCIKGLVKAAKHNGKVGKISATAAPEGRLGVKLDDGTTLAVRRANVDKIDGEVGGSVMDSAKQRTLTRDNSMLHEFNGNPDPNVLALYYHYGDRAFDCFNATEYNTQMLRYYAADIVVVLVVRRKIGQNDHFLVGLHHKIPENNTLCEVAFNCGRSFAGISMLVKKRCFVCNRPGAPMCKCKCACFCTTCKTNSGYALHEKVCKSIQASTITVEEESVQL